MKMQIFLALLVPALSGLAYIAYRHPKAYDKIYKKLYFSSTTVFLTLAAWDSGIFISNIKLKEKLTDINAKEIESVLEPLTINYWWLLASYLALCFYLLFLSILPNLIEDDESKK